jgi:hypothetical protein
MEFELMFLVDCFLSFSGDDGSSQYNFRSSCELAIKESNSFVTFGHHAHGGCRFPFRCVRTHATVMIVTAPDILGTHSGFRYFNFVIRLSSPPISLLRVMSSRKFATLPADLCDS